MVVVRHQAVGNHAQRVARQERLGAPQQEQIIVVIGKDAFAIASSVVDVVIMAS